MFLTYFAFLLLTLLIGFSLDLGLSPDGRVLWYGYPLGAFSQLDDDGLSNRHVLCFWRVEQPPSSYTVPRHLSWPIPRTYIDSYVALVSSCFHYWAHRALHHGQLYKKIHKLHHEFSAPFGLAAEYAHPLEILILGTGTIGGPLLWCLISKGNLHIMTMYIWIMLRLFRTSSLSNRTYGSVKTLKMMGLYPHNHVEAVDAHSGYDFPWSLHKIIPFWSGADHHDYHHEKFVGCYSTSFRWMDHLFGTDKSYKEYRKKQALEKSKKQGKKEWSL